MNIDVIVDSIINELGKISFFDENTLITIPLENDLQLDITIEGCANSFGDIDCWAWLTLANITANDYIIIDTKDSIDLEKDSITMALEHLFNNNDLEYF